MRSGTSIKKSPNRQEVLAESIEILSSEMNTRLSQEMDSLMNLMQTQINRAISSAINDRVLHDIQSIMGNLGLTKTALGRLHPQMSKVQVTPEDSRDYKEEFKVSL